MDQEQTKVKNRHAKTRATFHDNCNQHGIVTWKKTFADEMLGTTNLQKENCKKSLQTTDQISVECPANYIDLLKHQHPHWKCRSPSHLHLGNVLQKKLAYLGRTQSLLIMFTMDIFLDKWQPSAPVNTIPPVQD